ncbi:MAG TPA: hypothetical protein VD999_03860 [Vitreimonas sp.]|nr:hypothetical protein [Vitreimonas sp.]
MHIINWLFGIIFFVIGVLNLLLVHPVPGVFYLVLSLIYFPVTNKILQKNLGFTIPFALKVIVGLVIMWGTLAVGDLAEILGL